MSVVIYRNMLNAEMKRFGEFSKTIANNLKHNNIETSIIFDDKKYRCLSNIQNHNTIIFIAHGSADTIYHKYDHKYDNHQPLINKENASVLKDKKVIAISCGTAKILGPYACTYAGCKVYLGFLHKIHFNKKNEKPCSKKYREFLTICYKNCFAEIIEKAILEKWNFSKLALILKLKLNKTVVERAQLISKSKPMYYRYHGFDQAILAVTNVADNINVFGNDREIVE